MKVKINARLAFPALFEPKAVGGEGEPRFSAAFAIEPGSESAKALASAVTEVAKSKWGAKADGILAELKKKGRVCYKDSPLTNSEGEVYDGFEGMHSLNASSKARPTVIDRDRTPLVAADGRPYAGCYVNAIVELWAMDNQYGRRVNATLSGVQFDRDGDAFGSAAPASADDFDDLSGGAGDDLI